MAVIKGSPRVGIAVLRARPRLLARPLSCSVVSSLVLLLALDVLLRRLLLGPLARRRSMGTLGVVDRFRLHREPCSGGRKPVCRFWLQGRCSRHPCPFLHSRNDTPSHQRQPRSRVWVRDPSPSLVSPVDDDCGNRPPPITTIPDGSQCSPSPTPPPPFKPDEDEGTETSPITIAEDCPPPPPPPSSREDDHEEGPQCSPSHEDEGTETTAEDCPPPPPTSTEEEEEEEEEEGTTSFSFLTTLGASGGHRQQVTGIALPRGSDKLFSGSVDGTVRVWDCGSGQCVQVIEMGRPIFCVIADGHWVFAGALGGVHGCNTLTRTGLSLPGPSPAGQVCSLETGDDMLFAGVDDGCILAWRRDGNRTGGGESGPCFRPAASLLGGHTSAVVSLVVGSGRRLYSGSVDRTIRAWDMGTLQCCYVLSSAHDDTVTSLLRWSDFLLSCSLDGTLKVWASPTDGREGLDVVYTRDEGQSLLLLNGVNDTEGKPVLMCSLADHTVRLYDLPGFTDRGKILSKGGVTAMHTGPSGFFFTGDDTGELCVWRCPQQH